MRRRSERHGHDGRRGQRHCRHCEERNDAAIRGDRRRHLGKGLFEIRSNISDGRIARVIFAVVDEHMLLLHGFVKKTQKTPKPDLDLVARRLKVHT